MTDKPSGAVLPDKFTLDIKRAQTGGWFVTSDAHRGFLLYIDPETGLADGLREVPAQLRTILIAQRDADREITDGRLAVSARQTPYEET